MAEKKMGFEALLEEIEKKIGGWPGTQVGRAILATEDLAKYGLRKKPGSGDQSHWSVWALGVGQQGQQLNWFYDYRLLDVAKKAHKSLPG